MGNRKGGEERDDGFNKNWVHMKGNDQITIILRTTESDLLLLEEDVTNMEKGKTRMNPEILDCKWKY